MQLESKHNIARYILAFGGVQGLNIAIGIVRTKLVALLLGPNGMGIMSLYSSATQMMQNATNMGLDKSGLPMVSQAFQNADDDEHNALPTEVSDAVCRLRSLFLLAALSALVCGVMLSWLLSLIAFRDVDHTLHFIALSPAASLLIIATGEIVVLKAARRLRTVAILSLWNVVLALLVSVPLFYVWGPRGIIPSLVLTALTQILVTMLYSYHRYPLHISVSRRLIKESMPMLRLGMAFVIASAMTSGAEFLIRSFINSTGSDYAVGLYNTGCLIAITYGGMIFASIDSEYVPRLCQIDRADRALLNATVHRQIRVSLSFIIPMTIVLELLLPWLVPLLFSDRFVNAIPMAQVALLSLSFRAIYLPIGYVTLARSDTRTFLLTESLSAVMQLLCVCMGFHYGNLTGSAIGLVASHAFDMLSYILIIGRRHGLSLSANATKTKKDE